jgi:hypothetical protein
MIRCRTTVSLANLLNVMGLAFNVVAAGILLYCRPMMSGATTPADLEMLRELIPMLSALTDYRFVVLFIGFGMQFSGAVIRLLV